MKTEIIEMLTSNSEEFYLDRFLEIVRTESLYMNLMMDLWSLAKANEATNSEDPVLTEKIHNSVMSLLPFIADCRLGFKKSPKELQ